MQRPEFENLTSDIDEMISEKKLRFVGSSGSSNTIGEVKVAKLLEIVKVKNLVPKSSHWTN